MQSDQCILCKHYNFFTQCEAFPKGIPEEIFSGEFDHEEKYPGQDNDIVFEPIEE